jgi:threonine dehydratase
VLVSLADVERARELLAGVTRTTPLEPCRPLSAALGGPAWLKCENLQRAGSFKVRGAYVRIARLSDEERARGVVAASAGNHAQGVALGASLLGGKSVVFMPDGAPLPKIAATRSYGAEVIFEGATVDVALRAARAYAEERRAVFIHPFDHPDVIAGQGTIGLEILAQCPDVRTVAVGIGGGGLAAGIAAAVKAIKPDVRVIGVQAERAACFPASLAAGHPVTIEPSRTMADGITVGRPGELTFELVSQLVDSVLTVSEESLSQALLMCLERAKQLVEPAGAAAVAALLTNKAGLAHGTRTVATLSGGNIDVARLKALL